MMKSRESGQSSVPAGSLKQPFPARIGAPHTPTRPHANSASQPQSCYAPMPSRSQRKAHLSSREDSRQRTDGPYAPRQDRTFPCSASARPPPPHSHAADFLSIHAIPSCLQPVRLPVRNRFSPTKTETENLPDEPGITKPEPSRTVSRKRD